MGYLRYEPSDFIAERLTAYVAERRAHRARLLSAVIVAVTACCAVGAAYIL